MIHGKTKATIDWYRSRLTIEKVIQSQTSGAIYNRIRELQTDGYLVFNSRQRIKRQAGEHYANHNYPPIIRWADYPPEYERYELRVCSL